MSARRHERGVVLIVVLLFALLLAGTVATFLRRSTVDSMIAYNRNAAAQAEALARGGVRLATGLLLQDLMAAEGASPLDTQYDLWARAGDLEIETGDGGRLRLRIRDSGSLLNLNAVLSFALASASPADVESDPGSGPERDDDTGLVDASEARERARIFLEAFLEKVKAELPIPPGERELYYVPELAENLIDWVDPDEVRESGGLEDDFYQSQDPPYRAANRPLLSLDELRLVEGFDDDLVAGLRPYVTVYPYVPQPPGGGGVNLNTAPPHVLALLFYDDGAGVLRLADEDDVRRILEIRKDEGIFCEEQSEEGCTPISDVIPTSNTIYPAPTYSADVFTIVAEARVGEVRRRVEAVVDRSQRPQPLLLSWRVR